MKCKSSVALGLLIMISVSTSFSQVKPGWQASKETADKLTKSRSEFNYYEEKVPSYTLPDLMTTSGGKPVKTKKEWLDTRRPELLDLFRTNVFGRVPSTPWESTFKVVNTDRNAIGGAATLKQVEITISSGGKSLVIRLTLFTPNNKKGGAPTFLLIDNRGPANTDPTRVVKSEFWPVEEVIARGYGIAQFYNADVDPDKFDDFKDGIHAILDKEPRKEDSWGTLAAWAWGASRCMDYFETDRDVDARKVAVLGHSRGGKTALWAGAQDERFSIVISNESGTGGASLARRRFGETVERINTAFPHWFCLNYRKYNGREESMPVDMHMLIALTSPRAVYVACASDDLWGDPKGSYLALLASLPAFRLFDKNINLPPDVPPLYSPVVSGRTGYHIREGEHNLKLVDWNYFMDFAAKVWK